MLLLAISEILLLFVNTLTPDDKYSLCSENLRQQILMQLFKKQKTVSSFFLHF